MTGSAGAQVDVRSGTRLGDERLDFRIGDIQLAVLGLGPEQSAYLGERYAPYRTEVAASPCLTVRCSRGDRPTYLERSPGPEPELYRLLVTQEGSGYRVWSYDFAGHVDPTAGEATLLLGKPEPSPELERSLENFLRASCAWLARDRGGFLIHAAGIVDDDRAFVFFGHSGAGKSTTSGLSEPRPVLSDDLVLVLPDGDGLVAWGTPFRGLYRAPWNQPGGYPVRALLRLTQAPEHRIEPMHPARAVMELAACLPFLDCRPDGAGEALEAASAAVERAEVARLHFRRDSGFWEKIRDEF